MQTDIEPSISMLTALSLVPAIRASEIHGAIEFGPSSWS
jgi:hypothetical protein